MIQTGAEVPKDPRNPKQRWGWRAPRSSPARPANLLYADVGANFPWRLVRKEKPLKFLSLVLFPGVSSVLSVSLTPQHRRIFPPPPTKKGNDSFYQLKATFPVCCRCSFGCPPTETWNLSCFDWTLRSPGAVLYSNGVQSLRGKNIPDANTLNCECEFLPLWKSHGCWKCAAPTDFAANKLLLRNDSQKQKQGCTHIYLKRQTTSHVSLWSDLPSAA